MHRALAFLLAVLPLASCASGNEALRTATLSQEAGTPGYVVVGMVEQNYKFGVVYATQSVAVTLTSPGHDPVIAVRKGCGSLGGFIATKPCDISAPGAVVLQVPPGSWTLTSGTLAYHNLDGDQTLTGPVPPVTFALRSGEIVDLGEYVFASDADKKVMPLVRHYQDDGLTRATLAVYPGLQGAPVIYRGGAPLP
jgi:hypothetical protein